MEKKYRHRRCPCCGSSKTVPILYGDEEPVDFDLPPLRIKRRPQSTPGALFDAAPRWHCLDCGFSFDRPRNFESADVKYLCFSTGSFFEGYVRFYLWTEAGYCYHCLDENRVLEKMDSPAAVIPPSFEKIAEEKMQRGADYRAFGNTKLELPSSYLHGLMAELSEEQYAAEIKSLLACGILGWKRDSRDMLIDDGPEWSLDIRIEPQEKNVEPETIHILGNINYPRQWRKFINALVKITGRSKGDFLE